MWPETSWTVISEAQKNPTQDSALNRLFSMYWQPVYRVTRTQWNRSHEEAADLTQSYFTKFFEDKLWEHAEPSRGRLRSYFASTLRHFLLNRKRAELAKKRGGNMKRREFMEDAVDVRKEAGLFNAEEARRALRQSIVRLGREAQAEGRHIDYRLFCSYYRSISLGTPICFRDLSQKHELTTDSVRGRIRRQKIRLREILLSEVSKPDRRTHVPRNPQAVFDFMRH